MRSQEESLDYLRKNFNISKFTAPINSYFIKWLNELNEELRWQSNKIYKQLEGLLKTDRIFTVGKGRSELMIRNTGMRLMHEGFDVYRIGESYTPAIGNDTRYKDTLIFVSGSGQTKEVINAIKKAKENNVPIYGITSNKDSDAIKIAGEENVIITRGKKIYPSGVEMPLESSEPINFLQTKSEFKSLIWGELIVNEIAKAKGLTEADFKKRHANTE